MLETTVYSLGNPGSFDITDKTNPLYYIARFSHEQSKILYDLNQLGFVFRQSEDTDIQDIKDDFALYASSLETWMTTAVAASNDGLPIPAPPTLPTLPGNPLPGIIISILFKIAIRIFVDWLRKKLDPNTEAKEIAQVLKAALIGNTGGDDFPLIEMLGNTPLEIIFSKLNEYQDFLYSDRPEV